EIFEEGEHGDERDGEGDDGGGSIEDECDDNRDEDGGSGDAFPGQERVASGKNEEGLHRWRRDASEGEGPKRIWRVWRCEGKMHRIRLRSDIPPFDTSSDLEIGGGAPVNGRKAI